MSFDKMMKEFKDMAELQQYADAQFKLITDLNKQISVLKQENTHLKDVLAGSTPLLEEDKSKLLAYSYIEPDEKTIAEIELNKLKELSYQRPLTYEETKRVDIFAKILATFRIKATKDIEASSKNLSEGDLLKLVSPIDNESK